MNRKALINELHEKQITGKFLKSIKAIMHAVIEQNPKIKDVHRRQKLTTDFFQTF